MASPVLWKIFVSAAILFELIALVLGWVGYGVPDWQEVQNENDTSVQYYGLWTYCQQDAPDYNTNCRRWSSAAEQLYNGTTPNFVKTSQGLFTTGMILISLGLIAALIATKVRRLVYVAAGLAFLGFLLLVIGLPIFGRQSNDTANLQGAMRYKKRYGFWLMVPTIVLEFLASICFSVARVFYQRSGSSNGRSNKNSNRLYGGQRLLGPANFISGMGGYGVSPMYRMPSYVPPVQPSLLSQYTTESIHRTYSPVVTRQPSVTVLPLPSIIPISTQPSYVKPSYYRAPIVSPPVINLSGETIVGPLVRYS